MADKISHIAQPHENPTNSLHSSTIANQNLPPITMTSPSKKDWLVCTLFTYRNFNQEAMMNHLSSLWQLTDATTFQVMDDKITIIQTGCSRDKAKIKDEGPWYFNRSLVLVEVYDEDKRASDYSFQFSDFWIRICNLSPRLMSTQSAENIGNQIGVFVRRDDELVEGGWTRFLRISLLRHHQTTPALYHTPTHPERLF